ncbi:hypothetical protein PR048_023496 [Dryococelus australis]|uniref:Uncharacterized protein n=1 Tax=Dryococelus australis TaxID=614101 RepID=A0ABQ9GU93_9NEOP|nr:hypothetical protein PR048_023496 [Dryococelus australis]
MILLDLALEALTEICLNVHAIVCDQGTSNQKVTENIWETIFHVQTKEDTYLLFIIYHTCLNMKETIMSNDFVIDGQIITWRVIVNLMCSDTQNKLARATFKLIEQTKCF